MSIKKAAIIRGVVAALLIAFVAGFGLMLTYRIADTNRDDYFEQRKIQASTAAAAIDVGDVSPLKGNASDLDTAGYQRLRSQLVRIKRSDTHVRFVYLMRPQGGKMIFLVDAEDPSSQDYSPPGQVYDEAKPGDFDPFDGKAPPVTRIEWPIRDRWGTWASTSAYITDPRARPVALIGTDVDIQQALATYDQIKRLGLVFDLLAVVLLVMVATQYILWRYSRDHRLVLRAEMEQSAIRLNEELLRADRMKSDFIQLASHELRSPVNAVNVAISTMDKSLAGKLNKDELALVNVAKNGSTRLVDLVDNLLDFTRVEAGDFVMKPSNVDVGELLDRTVNLFEPLAGDKGLALSAERPEGGLMAFVDGQALLRILENLIGNALKFTESGSVTVRLETVDDNLRFTIEDTGPGIPTDFRDKLFEKFSKLQLPIEQRQKGAGMGLALCKGLVEAQGGRIWYESEEGKGSAFHLEIPRRQREE